MSIIKVNDIAMKYRVRSKEEGIIGSIKNLFTNNYTDINALNKLNFTIKEGEFIGLIGENGAGKTTLVKLLSGILTPNSGELKVLGYTPHKRKTNFKKNISVVMGQRSQLWWDLPARETFSINKAIYGVPEKNYNERLDYLIELLDISHKVDIPVRRLSLGERMKMELVASFLHYPKVLFLDEPTIGLDIISQRSIREFLKNINKDEKTTIILTSHYMEDIVELCERILILSKGNLIYDGPINNLTYNQDDSILITFYLNSSQKNKEAYQIGKLIKDREYEVSYKINKKDLQALLGLAINDFDIRDIKIQQGSIEDIIYRILNT